MAHDHHHHHHHHSEGQSLNAVFIFSIILNLLFVIIEAGIGFHSNSMGLVSDAGHNLSDVCSLILALVAAILAHTRSRGRFTYGYRKASVFISLANAAILLVAVGVIVAESIAKFSEGGAVDGAMVSWTAAIGILINGLTTFLLMRGDRHDINTRGAFLHMAADTLVSVGVLISGIVISHTGWYAIDPIIGLVVAAIILFSTTSLLGESFRMLIDAAPEGIDLDEIRETIMAVEGVKGMHHLHIWNISTTETALTAHVLVEDILGSEQTVHGIHRALKEKGISHSTIEVETRECGNEEC